MSGHADKNGLLSWITGLEKKPEKVFVVHGENETTDAFAKTLQEEYGLDAYAPYSGTEFDLATGQFIRKAEPIPFVKKVAEVFTGPYARLRAAGERLMAVIGKSQKMSNKDIAKFADQINAISDKMLKE